MLYIITDDLCPSNLKYFSYWDKLKKKYPMLKITCFTIACNNNCEDVSKSVKFENWYDKRRKWIEIGVHGYDHAFPPECERSNQAEFIRKSLTILKPYLPKYYGFRAPGFQKTIKTEPILKILNFSYIAYACGIRDLSTKNIFKPKIINTHVNNYSNDSINKIHHKIDIVLKKQPYCELLSDLIKREREI